MSKGVSAEAPQRPRPPQGQRPSQGAPSGRPNRPPERRVAGARPVPPAADKGAAPSTPQKDKGKTVAPQTFFLLAGCCVLFMAVLIGGLFLSYQTNVFNMKTHISNFFLNQTDLLEPKLESIATTTKALDEASAALKADKEALETAQKELDTQKSALSAKETDLAAREAAVDEAVVTQKAYQESLSQLASAISLMDAESVATLLTEYEDLHMAAQILRLLEPQKTADILSVMQPQDAAALTAIFIQA